MLLTWSAFLFCLTLRTYSLNWVYKIYRKSVLCLPKYTANLYIFAKNFGTLSTILAPKMKRPKGWYILRENSRPAPEVQLPQPQGENRPTKKFPNAKNDTYFEGEKNIDFTVRNTSLLLYLCLFPSLLHIFSINIFCSLPQEMKNCLLHQHPSLSLSPNLSLSLSVKSIVCRSVDYWSDGWWFGGLHLLYFWMSI